MSRWFYVFLGAVANVLLGTIYSWSVFRRPLEIALGWTGLESGIPFSIFLLFFAVNMPVSGVLLKRLGVRSVSLLGSALVGSGWLLTSQAIGQGNPLLFMIISYGVLAGTGVAMIYNSAITVSSNWFEEKRGLAVGLTVLGFGISPLITAPLANFLIYSVGVVLTFAYLGIAYGLALALLSMLIRLPVHRAGPVGMGGGNAIPAARGLDFTAREMVKTRAFVGLWSAYVLGTMGGFIAISLSAKFGEEVIRLTPELAAAATAVYSVFNGLGRPLFGYVADRLHVRAASLIAFVLGTVGSLIAIYADSLVAYLVSYSLLWLVFGGWLAIAPKATSTFFGLRNLSINYGLVFVAYGVSALTGPSLASLLWLATQSYQPVFMTVALLSLLGFLVSHYTLRPPLRRGRDIPLVQRAT